MPRGLKETSSIIAISAEVTTADGNTFADQRVDLQLNPLDNEVFVVYGIDLDLEAPDLVGATSTVTRGTVSTTQRTATGGLAQSNVLASSRIETQEAGGASVTNEYASDSAPATMLEYIGIIATNDFYLNISGANNTASKVLQARVYGVRAKADASVYASLVQSELLS